MMSVLAIGAAYALAELFDTAGLWGWLAVTFVLSSWVFWGLIFAMVLGDDYLKAVRRIVLWLMGGSLLQLIVTVQAHLTVTRRGGCMVGIGTGMGVSAGVCVLLWAFGPGIILLFMHEARKSLVGFCAGCGYSLRGLTTPRCPECGRGFTPREAGVNPDN